MACISMLYAAEAQHKASKYKPCFFLERFVLGWVLYLHPHIKTSALLPRSYTSTFY